MMRRHAAAWLAAALVACSAEPIEPPPVGPPGLPAVGATSFVSVDPRGQPDPLALSPWPERAAGAGRLVTTARWLRLGDQLALLHPWGGLQLWDLTLADQPLLVGQRASFGAPVAVLPAPLGRLAVVTRERLDYPAPDASGLGAPSWRSALELVEIGVPGELGLQASLPLPGQVGAAVVSERWLRFAGEASPGAGHCQTTEGGSLVVGSVDLEQLAPPSARHVVLPGGAPLWLGWGAGDAPLLALQRGPTGQAHVTRVDFGPDGAPQLATSLALGGPPAGAELVTLLGEQLMLVVIHDLSSQLDVLAVIELGADAPRLAATLALGPRGTSSGLALAGSHALLLGGGAAFAGLQAIDLSTPEAPTAVAVSEALRPALAVTPLADGDLLLIGEAGAGTLAAQRLAWQAGQLVATAQRELASGPAGWAARVLPPAAARPALVTAVSAGQGSRALAIAVEVDGLGLGASGSLELAGDPGVLLELGAQRAVALHDRRLAVVYAPLGQAPAQRASRALSYPASGVLALADGAHCARADDESGTVELVRCDQPALQPGLARVVVAGTITAFFVEGPELVLFWASAGAQDGQVTVIDVQEPLRPQELATHGLPLVVQGRRAAGDWQWWAAWGGELLALGQRRYLYHPRRSAASHQAAQEAAYLIEVRAPTPLVSTVLLRSPALDLLVADGRLGYTSFEPGASGTGRFWYHELDLDGLNPAGSWNVPGRVLYSAQGLTALDYHRVDALGRVGQRLHTLERQGRQARLVGAVDLGPGLVLDALVSRDAAYLGRIGAGGYCQAGDRLHVEAVTTAERSYPARSWSWSAGGYARLRPLADRWASLELQFGQALGLLDLQGVGAQRWHGAQPCHGACGAPLLRGERVLIPAGRFGLQALSLED